MKKKIFTSFAILSLISCAKVEGEQGYPKSWEEAEEQRIGKLTGEEGLVLFGGSKKSGATEGINVNSYLWRAALDYIARAPLPMLSADPFGGTIITDWYTSGKNSRERFKLNIFITRAELSSDGVNVTAFKQVKDKNGNWSETQNSPKLGKLIEDKILLAARKIKYGSPR